MAEETNFDRDGMECTQSSSEDKNDTDNIDILLTAAKVIERNGQENRQGNKRAQDNAQEKTSQIEEKGKEVERKAKNEKTPDGRKDPETGRSKKTKSGKLTLKSVQAMSSISLEVLKNLSPKLMANIFMEEMENPDQYSKKCTFRCRFFSDVHEKQCSKDFHGFRGTQAIKSDIEKHLVDHVHKLIQEGAPFETTSLQYRKKQQKTNKEKKAASPQPSKKSKSFTSLKTNAADVETQSDKNSDESDDRKPANKKRKMPTDNKENNPTASTSRVDPAKDSESKKRRRFKSGSSNTSLEDSVSEARDSDDGIQPDYPHCDHTYAAVTGRKPKQGRAASPQSDSDSSLTSGVSLETPDSQGPADNCDVIYDGLGVANHETISEQEEYVDDKNLVQKKDSSNNTGNVAKKPRSLTSRRKVTHIPDDEKKKAFQYMEELKNRKKDVKIPWMCKICPEGKTFTAGASLLNHYKSHAGMKPFECQECGASFTRQHSLLYHKRIHTGEIKHTCQHCGRKFRHSAHFKEHLRKHTGETPYTCGDCDLKFKTRNTYKRHLKTHHGKLLTKDGIRNLSESERALVRTKKYKKSGGSSPSSSPELKAADQKKGRKGKIGDKPNITIAPAEAGPSTVTQRIALPPVSSFLPSLQPVAPSSTVQVNPAQVVATVSQPSVGVMPPAPIGVVGQTSPATMGVLGMTVMAPGVVVCAPGATPAQVTLVQQPYRTGQPATIVCQPAVPIDNHLQGQAYYTLNTLVHMDNSQPVYPAQQRVSHTSDVDMSDYKPVGYISHT